MSLRARLLAEREAHARPCAAPVVAHREQDARDGSAVPALHALPPETATPSRSSAATSSGRSIPGTRRSSRGGRAGRPAPLTRAPGASRAVLARARRAAARGRPTAQATSSACRAAAASPAAATGSTVPGRRPRSWLPPSSTGTSASPGRATSAPIDFGPADLVRGEAPRVGASAATSSSRPNACTASTWTSAPAALRAGATHLRDGLHARPSPAFTACTRDEPRRRPRRGRARKSLEVDRPAPARRAATERARGPPARAPRRRAPPTGARDGSSPGRPRRARREGAPQRQVVRLGPARGEHDVARVARREPRHGLARLLDARTRRAPEGVNARRVAPRLARRAPPSRPSPRASGGVVAFQSR